MIFTRISRKCKDQSVQVHDFIPPKPQEPEIKLSWVTLETRTFQWDFSVKLGPVVYFKFANSS